MPIKSMNSSNNKKDEVPELLEDEKELDAIIDADFAVPIKPKWVGTRTTKTKGYRFYLEIKPKLREWWDEFNTAQNVRGTGIHAAAGFSESRMAQDEPLIHSRQREVNRQLHQGNLVMTALGDDAANF